MLKALYVCGFVLVLSVPCAAEVTSVTCLGVDVRDGGKDQYEIEWDDSQRDRITVNGARVPRTSPDRDITLEDLGNALISWCVTFRANGNRICNAVDRTSGSFERTWEGTEGRRVIQRGTCRKSSEATKF